MAAKHASQFSKLLQNVTYYIQFKYNSDVAEAIRTMEEQVFTYPEKPTVTYVKDENGKETEVMPDKSDFFMWRWVWDKVNDWVSEYRTV